MDSRLLVFIASLGLLGFLFYPRPEPPSASATGEWVATIRKVDGEPARFPTVQRADPVLATYDLGFVYRLDRFDLGFDKPTENGPKLYEALVSPTREGPYKRVFSLRSASRFYPYSVQNLSEPAEARWVQVAVTDWFSGRPAVKSFQAGPLYRRDWNPIRGVTVSHNAPDATFLTDGVTTTEAKWAGARIVDATTEKDGKKTTEKQRRAPNSDVWAVFDLGTRQRIYGTRVTTDGNGNCPKSYRLLLSDDGRAYELAHTSAELSDETRAIAQFFPDPLEARFVRLEIQKGAWHGDYPELREFEAFTDSYRLPPPKPEAMSDYNPIAVGYDNGGVDARRSPHRVAGFVFDRGQDADPSDRYAWRADEIEGAATEAQRTFLYHYDALRFEFAGLNPSRLYWLQVTTLQNKAGGRLQNLIADGYLLHGDEVPVPSGSPQPTAYFIPTAAVEDGIVDVAINRLAGPNAVVSELTLFEARRSVEEAVSAPVAYAHATRTPSPLALDGRLDDWDRLYPLRANGDFPDPEAYLQWNDENLFVAVSVPRRLFSKNSSLLDTLDLYIDSLNTKSPTTYRKGDLHLRVFRFGSGKELVRFVKHYSEETVARTDVPPVEFASGRQDDRLILEMRLPRSNLLDAWEPRIGGFIGFNYAIATRDDRRAWWASEGADDPPSRWRTVRLGGSIRGEIAVTPHPPPDAEAPFSREPSDRFNAGDALWLVVRDPDRNRDARASESVAVTVRGGAGGERELTLREVDAARLYDDGVDKSLAADSETFAAILETEFGALAGDVDRPFVVRGGDTLAFLYRDPFYDPSGKGSDVESVVMANTGVTGALTVADADGNPLSSFAAGAVIRVEIRDADLTTQMEPTAGSDASKAPVRRFGLSFRSGADRATVEMVETEPGVFVGELPTEYGDAANLDDGVLQVTGAETVQAVYFDGIQESGRTRVPLTASLRVEIGANGLVRLRSPGAAFAPESGGAVDVRSGAGLIARVEDADLNRDPNAVETASVALVGDTTGDRLAVTLRESGLDSAVFEAFVKTRYATTPTPDNDTLELVGGETVTATYTDAIQGSGETGVAVSASARAVAGRDGTLALTRADYLKRMTRFNAGDTIYVRVGEGDPDDRLVVEALAERTGDREEIAMSPSATEANAYLGSLTTAFGERGVPNDGTLHVIGEDAVTVVYRDALRANGESDTAVTEICRVNAGNDGALRIARLDSGVETNVDRRFRAGETLRVEVNDSDLNAFSEAIEQVVVTVAEDALGDRVEVTLRETSGNSGVFRGEVTTEFADDAQPNDAVLQTRGGSAAQFEYVDALRANGDVNVALEVPLTVEAGVTGQIAFLSPDGTRRLGSLAPGDTVRIFVSDADRNSDPAVAERIEATITGETFGDTVSLPLLETDANSGEFAASLPTSRANSPSEVIAGDLVLQIGARERLTATYRDGLTSDGESDVSLASRAVAAGSAPGSLLFVDERGNEIGSVRAGETALLALDDIFLSAVGESETATALIQGTRTNDRMTVTLRAVAGNTGRYVGSLATRFGQTPVLDDTLDVQGGEEIRASYTSPMAEPFRVEAHDTVTVAQGSQAKLSVVRADDNVLRTVSPGSTLRFRLDDPDANADPNGFDTVTIRVGVENAPVSREVTLREEGSNAGVFRGTLATTLGRSAAEDALPLRGGERIAAVYRDALTSAGETNVETTAATRVRQVGFAPFTSEEVVVNGISDRWPLEAVMSSADDAALVWAQWGRDALYLFAQIEDEQVTVKDPTRWHEDADAIEFHIGTNPDGEFHPTHLDDSTSPSEFIFWFCPKGAGIYGERPYVGRARPSRQANFSPPIQVAEREDGSTYRLEIRIPFQRALTGFDPITSTKLDRIGFNYLVYRSNAPRVWWSPPESPDDPPSAYGVLYLRRPELGNAPSTTGGRRSRVVPSRSP